MIGQIVSKFGGRLGAVRYIGALALAIVALSATVGAALAAEPDWVDPATVRELIVQLNEASDPDAVFAQLTPEQQAAVIEALAVATVEVVEEVYMETAIDGSLGDASAAGERCGVHSRETSTKNLIGAKLWTYKSKTRWCFDGSVITKEPTFTPSGKVHIMGWEFVGHVDKSDSGGKGEWMYEDFAQGHFRFCVLGIGCTSNHYPDITKRQYADGTFEWDINH